MTSGLVAGTLGLIALTGLDALDALAALGIAVVVARRGVDLIRSVRPGDEGLDAAEIAAVARVLADGPPAVIGYRRLRARTAGGVRRIDVDVTVRRDATAAQVDTVRQTIGDALEERLPDARIVVHVVRPTAASGRSSDASRTMSEVRSRRSRRACCSPASLRRLSAPPAAAPPRRHEPIDQYYSASVSDGGWLERIAGTGTRPGRPLRRRRLPDDRGRRLRHRRRARGVRRRRRHRPRAARTAAAAAPGRTAASSQVADMETGRTARSSPGWRPRPPTASASSAPRRTRPARGAHRPDDLRRLACALDYLAKQMDSAVGLLVVNLSLTDPRRRRPPCGGAEEARAPRGADRGGDGQPRASGTRLGFPARLPHVLADRRRGGPRPAARPGARPAGPRRRPLAPVVAAGAGGTSARRRRRRPRPSCPAPPRRCGARTRSGSALTAQQVAWLLRTTAAQRRTLDAAPRASGGSTSAPRCGSTRGSPRDDESEPNDSASDASGGLSLPPLACVKTCTRRRHRRHHRRPRGLVGRPHPRQPQGLPPGRRARQLQRGPGTEGLAYVRVTTKRASTGYTLKVRAGRNC